MQAFGQEQSFGFLQVPTQGGWVSTGLEQEEQALQLHDFSQVQLSGLVQDPTQGETIINKNKDVDSYSILLRSFNWI